jgi:putative NADH-flavin reductase
MKIVIFGASGKTGMLLVNQALEAGHAVTVFVRNASPFQNANKNLTIVQGTLSDLEKLTEAINGADVCVSTLGGNSLTKRSPQITAGIQNIVHVMELQGVKRLIYMSSLGAGESKYYMPAFIRFIIVNLMLRIPLADHNQNEQNIMKSKLDWTLVRPGGLTDGVLNKNIKHGSEFILMKQNNSISRASVASFILDQVADSQYIKKAVWLLV